MTSPVALGPLTLEEAERVISSRPPPFSLEDHEARLRQLEAKHVQMLAAAEQRDRERASLSPAPDYAIEGPAEPEACSCDEALALRDKLAEALVEIARLRGQLDAAEKHVEIAQAATRDEHVRRVELERAIYVCLRAGDWLALSRVLGPEYAVLFLDDSPMGTCARCGKRAPLKAVGVPHGAEKYACAWGCSVEAEPYRDLGNLAIEATRGELMRCSDCRVSWTGCAAVCHCPECGKEPERAALLEAEPFARDGWKLEFAEAELARREGKP